MKITPTVRKAINAEVRRLTRGASPIAEVGLRGHRNGTDWTPNEILWEENHDLIDLTELRHLTEVEEAPEHPGKVALDLYVTSGHGTRRELETNVGVYLENGRVVFAWETGSHAAAEEFERNWLGAVLPD